MSTVKQSPPNTTDGPEPLSETDAFEVLRNQRRRYVLKYLQGESSAIELGELATQVAAMETGEEIDRVTSTQRKRVYTTLQQTHLPKMDDLGIIQYNHSRSTIEPTDQLEDLTIYLEVLHGREIAWREVYFLIGLGGLVVAGINMLNLFPFSIVPTAPMFLLFAAVVFAASVVHLYSERQNRLGDRTFILGTFEFLYKKLL